ncbi:uncharacterized protein LAESUDRAFT_731370 [Laetiporus sulphureus 93-53]|uniref:Uncharacterized protein n=1 Tax=Laetiporus sulphureus 93-53 TaxID=1314785 RepID=A0A165BLT9_9APHY|nr:uncharacterized protein LAESUDRAFT_731370 [Laetiporus sulphureus 93-53]KZT01284.1 hypothetical protein LAESUDRAFT_731370 [Laetiporus sulphureus 93-53]
MHVRLRASWACPVNSHALSSVSALTRTASSPMTLPEANFAEHSLAAYIRGHKDRSSPCSWPRLKSPMTGGQAFWMDEEIY